MRLLNKVLKAFGVRLVRNIQEPGRLQPKFEVGDVVTWLDPIGKAQGGNLRIIDIDRDILRSQYVYAIDKTVATDKYGLKTHLTALESQLKLVE